MPVAPDLLMTTLAAPAPKAAPAKSPQSTAEPSRKEASSFSQVYAKERQSKPAERTEGAARQARDNRSEPTGNDGKPAPAAEQPAAVADSGKALPADGDDLDDGAPESVEDPLLLLGLFDAQPVSLDGSEQALEEPALALTTSAGAGLAATSPVSQTEPEIDPDIEVLNSLPAVTMALDIGAQEKLTEQSSLGAAAAPVNASSAQSFASAMATMGLNTSASTTDSEASGENLDVPLLELTAEGLEALKESSADTPPEQFVSKLSALSQAIGQQAGQVNQLARAPVVPGQPVAMHQAGWSEGVVDKVMWMSSQNLKSAEIQLDPAELGRLDVRISLNQDQTQISFASAHPGVREALESQVHRLREMFTQQGLNLADVNVSDQSQGRAWQGQDNDGRGRSGSQGGDSALGSVEGETVIGSVELREPVLGAGRGMVDYYA